MTDDWPPDEPYLNGDHPSPFNRHDLAEVVRRPAVEPRTLDGLVYPGKLHSLAGPPEAGKTVLCFWLAMRAMAHGHPVLIMDEEAGPDQSADLFRSMGADPAILDKYLHYIPFPAVDWRNDHAIAHLAEFMERHRPVLSVWDSSAAMMALSGCKEIDPGDVTRFWKRVFLPVGQGHGCAVLVTDHVAKGGTDQRGGRGTEAKLAEVDVQLRLTAVRNFSHHQDGLLSLEVTKDRPGWLHRHWQIAVTRDPLALDLARTTAPAQPSGAASGGPSPAMLSLINALNDIPSTIKVLVDRIVTDGGVPLRRDTASRLLSALADAGQAVRIDQGKGREALWLLPGGELAPPADPADPGQNWEPGTNGEGVNP